MNQQQQQQHGIEVAKRMAEAQAQRQAERKPVLNETKLDQAIKALGLPANTHYADVCRTHVSKNGGSTGQAVDACGVNSHMIGLIWRVRFDMDARYGPYQTG